MKMSLGVIAISMGLFLLPVTLLSLNRGDIYFETELPTTNVIAYADREMGAGVEIKDEKTATSAGFVSVGDVTVETLSVSCLKVTAEYGRDCTISVETDAPYEENITVLENEGCYYLTGLRENSEYTVTVTPVLSESEERSGVVAISTTTTGKTTRVTLLQEYPKEEGWTNCFAGERASGLTLYPSYDAIVDTKVDEITGTGIRRNEFGDYCCAMGLWYGKVGDRFLVELENGTQFTVQICDSKGMADDADGDGEPDGRFHWFGHEDEGKCVIEFIYDSAYLPDKVLKAGSWGYYNWNGLDLRANIESIHKIA